MNVDDLEIDFPRQGEVWLVDTPLQPSDPHQTRPALIVSEYVRNSLSDDVIVVPIFSSGRAGPTRVPIQSGEGGIEHDSVLFCEEVTTLEQTCLVTGPLGPVVEQPLLEQVIRGIRRALGEAVSEPS